jgi:hypothetical protein
MKRAVALMLATLILALGIGCAFLRKPAPPATPAPSRTATAKAGALTPEELDRLVKEKTAQDPILRSQVDVGLEASAGQAGAVQVTLTNKTQQPLIVGPKNFGLIPPGERKVVGADIHSQRTFPVTKVAPGEQASGELMFFGSAAPRGGQLVFDPKGQGCQPARTRIQ